MSKTSAGSMYSQLFASSTIMQMGATLSLLVMSTRPILHMFVTPDVRTLILIANMRVSTVWNSLIDVFIKLISLKTIFCAGNLPLPAGLKILQPVALF